jgi:hypothetical protein
MTTKCSESMVAEWMFIQRQIFNGSVAIFSEIIYKISVEIL